MSIQPIRPLFITAMLTLLLLQGCGFHLRGVVELPQEMSATWISGGEVSAGLREAVAESIRNSQGEIASTAAASTAVLTLSGEDFSRRVATVDSSGKVSEYQLSYQVGWKLRANSGKILGEGVLKQRENYQYSTTQVLGKGQEEQHLRSVMVREAVGDLMRALRQR